MSEASGSAPARIRAAGPPSLGRLLIRHVVMAAVVTAILILGSGRADWVRAWLYIAVTFGVQVVVVIDLHRNNPDLLVERRRMQPGTKNWDKVLAPVIAIVGPMAIWVAAAWEARVQWPSAISGTWSAAGFLVCAVGATVVSRAMLANRFFSATVRIQSERGHVVVDEGPYRYVRHPGYAGALLFTLATPVALGSTWAMIPAGITGLVLVLRTALEDATLRAELPGYAEYTRRVRQRLVPWVW